MSILNVAISGLNAAQIGLKTTSHNIANASTEGYHRQRVIQTTQLPVFTGAGFIGQGTLVETIRRDYDRMLNEQMLSSSSGAAEMESFLAQIRQLDDLLADPAAGLSPALANFFRGVQEATANPASVPARQAMLAASEALVARFGALDQRMSEVRAGINATITSEVTAINAYARQIAEINQRIILAQAAGPSQPANDLMDQRDQLVAELNTKIRAMTIVQDDGTYSVFIGNGQPLVVGALSYQMSAVSDPADLERTVVALRAPNGTDVVLPEYLLTGGSLGGILRFRRESLDAAQSRLGEIAYTLAQDFNRQHALGQDLDGQLGGLYFDVSRFNLVDYPNRLRAADLRLAIADPRDIALAAPIRTATPLTNTGTARIDAGSVSTTASLPLTSPVTLTYDAGSNSFTATGGVSGGPFPYSPGQPISFGGLTVTILGVPAHGDSFIIENNLAGVADNRNGVLLGALQTQNTMEGNTATYASVYAAIVASVGNKAREVEITGKAQQSLYEQAKAARDSVAGVNLDEEAAQLLRYQQAYQAAAKVIATASRLFDEILAVMR